MAGKKNLKGWVKTISAKAGAVLSPTSTPPPAEAWQPHGQPYPRLLSIDPSAAGLKGMPGLFAIWHLGVRPQWLKVAASRDLASTLAAAKITESIVFFQPNGGVYCAWAAVAVQRAPAAAMSVAATVRPACQSLVLADELPMPEKAADFPLPPGVQSPRLG